MIDKKISLGQIITLATLLGTFLYTQGETSNRIETIEKDVSSHSVKINKNVEKNQEVEVSVVRIETKMEEAFKRFETFLLENY